MATEVAPDRQSSVSQSDSNPDTKSKNTNKYHIPVIDFEDYQQQQNEDDDQLQSSRDDMFLHRPNRQKKRHSKLMTMRSRASIKNMKRSHTMTHGTSHPFDMNDTLTQIEIARSTSQRLHRHQHKNNKLTQNTDNDKQQQRSLFRFPSHPCTQERNI